MLERQHDPIVAIATAPGRGAVGIVRVSGLALAPLARALFGRELEPRVATYLPFSAADGGLLDQGLALYFPAPRSYTGEDVLELQAHGGPVVLQLLLARCLQAAAAINPVTGRATLAGLRLAGPGEFSERAFLNDKMDLAQAEAIADLIDASTEAAARSAGRSMAGAFSLELGALREALIHLRMLVEATLDFPEEEIDFLRQADAQGQLVRLQLALAQLQQRAHQGALLREGIKIVIAGQPNAGKSSLLNALAGAELAIVTPIAGTTRDKVQQTIQIEGVQLHVIDTAGLREGADEVERMGIARAWAEIEAADAVLFLHDLTRMVDPDAAAVSACIAADLRIAQTLREKLSRRVRVLDVWNKVDLRPGADIEQLNRQIWGEQMPADPVALSATTGAGLKALRQRLLGIAGWQSAAEGVYMARARHLHALSRVHDQLASAQQRIQEQAQALDLLAEDLRLAQAALNEITGEFGSDDLLGVIFAGFCIGK